MRLNDIASQSLASTRIVIPLPGDSNPYWQDDWVDISCGESILLRALARRVLDFYKIPERSFTAPHPLTFTLIDRKQKRRLLDQDAYFSTLQAKYPEIQMQVVDYAALSLSEQIRISHSTDILAGVHGAGLTHGMFLSPNSTIVEILPPDAQGFWQHGKIPRSPVF